MSTYTGTCIKDLDVTTPTEGATGTIPEFNDCMRETKTVIKNQNAITAITGDTTLDATHSTIIFNKATAIAATLPTASTVASATFIKEYYFKNIGVGTATVTGTVTLNGTATSNPTLVTNDEMRIWTNGTTWYGVKYSSTHAVNVVPMGCGVIGFTSANSATSSTTLDMGTVVAGDIIDVSFAVKINGPTTGNHTWLVDKSAGSSTVVFENGQLSGLYFETYINSSGTGYLRGRGICQVSVGGTLTLRSSVVSIPTPTGYTSNEIAAFFLKKL